MTPNCQTFLNFFWRTIWEHFSKRYYFWIIIKEKWGKNVTIWVMGVAEGGIARIIANREQ